MKLSVVIPAYNAEKTIKIALASVYSQGINTNDFEVIIINDGSKDHTIDVINFFVAENNISNLTLIDQDNRGVASARNEGLRIASGKYVAFLDSDDEWLHDKIDAQIKIMDADDSICLVGGKYNDDCFDLSHLEEYATNVYIISFEALILKNYFQPSTVMLRRSVLSDVGLFKEGMRHAEEGLFFYNIAFSYKCAFINKQQIIFGGGKSMFGESGLSGDLFSMERGELHNYVEIYKAGKISRLRFYFLVVFSLLKFVRRIVICFLINKRA
nr:glycosyltransferase family 2 protein [Plesiomonas shigelloides]